MARSGALVRPCARGTYSRSLRRAESTAVVLPLLLLVVLAVSVQRGAEPTTRLSQACLQDRPGRFGSALWGARVGGRECIAIGAPGAGLPSTQDRGEVLLIEERRVAWRAQGTGAR